MPPLNVYYAIFHVFKRYSQQLVIYLLHFSLWFSSILSSDSGTSSPISSISISLTCLCFRLLTSSTRSLINGSTKYCFYLEGLTSLYINNTEEKRTRENYKKSQSSCSLRSEDQGGKLLKEKHQESRNIGIEALTKLEVSVS